ncbi:MAG: MaoC family dehydratase [Chloroflexi bacterium]|nr:MaoC family dehydratase [Chloroflexota bacterium]
MSFTIGQQATFSKKVTEADVMTFAEISGDKNPLHLDTNYARQTRFGARIAHGAFTFGVISAAIGMKLPGPGSIYLGQDLDFLKPVMFDDTLTATVEITGIRADKGIVTLKTDCTNQRGEKVAEGEAVVFHENAKSSE